MPRRPPSFPEPEPIEARWLAEAQTARNLEGLQAEQEGRVEDALAHYERNASEGFPGDWPYGRLVALYERAERWDDAERVLTRAIETFRSTDRRTAADRRTLVGVFRRRLAMVRRARRQAAIRGRT